MVAAGAEAHGHTDEQLMGRVASGDVRAFEVLYDRHSRQAFGLSKRITGRAGDAEEATQDAFLSLWRAAPSFDPKRASVRAWLLTMVRNRSIDIVRKAAPHALHREHMELAAETLEAPDRTEEQVLVLEDYRDARRLVAELPPEQREVIGLAYLAGQTQAEIATRVGVPVGTVKGRTRLALRKLRRAANPESLPLAG